MKTDIFLELMQDMHDEEVETHKTKGMDYTKPDGSDSLLNFKMLAKRLGITPYQVLGCYLLKHTTRIENFICTGEEPKGEPLEQSVKDARLFLALLKGLRMESSTKIGMAPPSEGLRTA